MRFHTYGSVEIAIEADTADSTFARMSGEAETFQHRETGEVEFDEFAGPQPEMGWFNVETGEQLDAMSDGRTDLFDAGATLCWFERDRFMAADAAMGDPYP